MQSTFLHRSLTAAIGLSLLAATAMTAPSASFAHGVSAEHQVAGHGPLVFFGNVGNTQHVQDFAGAVSGDRLMYANRLGSADISRLKAPATQAMAVVAASELDNLGQDRATLSALFEAGVPVFVCMDDQNSKAVSRTFGISPPGGDVIFIRERTGNIDILSGADDVAHWMPHWTSASIDALGRFQSEAAFVPLAVSTARGAAGDDSQGTVPILRIHEGQFHSDKDEITGKLAIDVIRTADRSGDDKEIHVYVWPTYAPKGYEMRLSGIYEGHKEGVNLTAAYLPWAYRVSHKVSAPGQTPLMVAHLPATEPSTEFNYDRSSERTFNIGGTSGDSLSADGKPDSLLAAKIPFNISVGYSHTTREQLSFKFKDYALLAREIDGGKRMLWEAPIAEKLKHVLVEKVYADRVVLSEKGMTPMMKTASFATSSVWKLPGTFEGVASVEISAGFDLNTKKWWWSGPDWRHSDTTAAVDKAWTYDLDLSHPYLTREITVLLRSEQGVGSCIAQRKGVVELAACDPMDRDQMWGLDSEGRYVNRGNKQCLQADFTTKTLFTKACSLSNDQRWEWRADRIHSGYDGRLHRLHVQNGQLRFFTEAGRFEDVPVNPHSPALKPWSGYPSKPLTGELVPAPFGTVPGHVPAEWSARYGHVGVEQRWSPVVMRSGLE